MSVTGSWDEAFAAAMEEKSEILTRTLQWIFKDTLEISSDYDIRFRKLDIAGVEHEVDFIADNAFVVSVLGVSGRMHVEIQAGSITHMRKRMLEYGAALSAPLREHGGLLFPAQAIVTLAPAKLGKSKRVLETNLFSATTGTSFGVYKVPVRFLDEESQDTIFWPTFKSEASGMIERADVDDWRIAVRSTAMQLPQKAQERYITYLKKAVARRYRIKEDELMGRPDLRERYKDIRDPMREARAEERDAMLANLITYLVNSGLSKSSAEKKAREMLFGVTGSYDSAGDIHGLKLD